MFFFFNISSLYTVERYMQLNPSLTNFLGAVNSINKDAVTAEAEGDFYICNEDTNSVLSNDVELKLNDALLFDGSEYNAISIDNFDYRFNPTHSNNYDVCIIGAGGGGNWCCLCFER